MVDMLVRGHSATTAATFLDGEDPVTGLSGVTVDIVDDLGDAVATGLSATEGSNEPGTWRVALTAEHTATCRPLVATWGDGDGHTTTTDLEVVGGHYFDLATLRARHGLADRTRYTTEDLARARAWVTQLIDTECGTSFVERYHRDDLPACELITRFGNIRPTKPYPRAVLSVTLDGTDLDAETVEALAVDPIVGVSYASRTRFIAVRRVVIRYTAAAELACPADLAEEAMAAAAVFLTQAVGSSGTDPRARGLTNEYGNVSLSDYPPGFERALRRARDSYRVPGLG